MAKKSLKKRIDDLIDALGRAKKPSFAEIRNELALIGPLAETLEDGQALSEKDARIAALETELSDLKISMDVTTGELETFRKAREKQQEEERKEDIPPEQLNILRRLPSKHGGKGLTVQQIWREVGCRLDELDIHVDKLEKTGLITWRTDSSGETFWLRSKAGNELIVAKRLAGEEKEEGEQEEEHPELTQMETFVLMALAHDKCSPEYIEEYIAMELPTVGPAITSPGMMLLLLIKLREKKLVSDADKPSDGGPSEWKLLRAGTRLLASRGLI